MVVYLLVVDFLPLWLNIAIHCFFLCSFNFKKNKTVEFIKLVSYYSECVSELVSEREGEWVSSSVSECVREWVMCVCACESSKPWSFRTPHSRKKGRFCRPLWQNTIESKNHKWHSFAGLRPGSQPMIPAHCRAIVGGTVSASKPGCLVKSNIAICNYQPHLEKRRRRKKTFLSM